MSMRTKTLLQNLFMLLAAAVIVGCDKEVAVTPEPAPESTLEAEVVNITDTSLEFAITSTNVDEVRYIILKSDSTAPTNNNILTSGSSVTPNDTANVIIDELLADTAYTLYVAAKSGDRILETQASAQTAEAGGFPDTDALILVESVTDCTATFNITTQNSEAVKYLLTTAEEGYPDEEVVQANGIALEPNTTQEVTLTELEAATDYILTVSAKGKGLGTVASYPFTTAAAPTVSAALTEDVGTDYAVITVEWANAATVKYVCIEAGSRDVTAEQVIKNGTDIESGEVRISDLKQTTLYEAYVAVESAGGTVVMADVVNFTTLTEIKSYVMASESTTAESFKYGEGNYYITFIDDVAGYTLRADFYCDDSNNYLASGTYTLGGNNNGEISKSYTLFMFTPTYTPAAQFASGYLDVVASPNEETREIIYTIYGQLFFDDGSYAELNFNNSIANISLPEIEDPNADNYYTFEVSPSTNMPKRVHGSNLVAGEYYIKFYDANWNELSIDLRIDPALCNNGAAALPEGIYSTGDGSLDTYSSISLYNPYFGGNFTEAELEVGKDGDIYTFKFSGTAVSGSESKAVKMEYTGEIADMTL